MKDVIKVRNSSETSSFYDQLMAGDAKRGILGKETRFNPLRVASMPSIKKYYADVVKNFIKPGDTVLDFGSGPGSFMIPVAPMCKRIEGVEISRSFVTEGQRIFDEIGLQNARLTHIEPDVLPFDDAAFDVVIMVDVIHHLENIDKSLTEVMRVLKPGARVLIYEPNKLNPLLYLVHLLDRNEWGLLRLGTPWKYRRVLRNLVNVESIEFNGIVIGPQSRVFRLISDLLNSGSLKPLLGWLNPKMFIRGTKKA